MIDGVPLLVSYGMGVDSTAMLVGLAARNIRPDLITMADTGNELPETYAYLAVINRWLRSVGFPEVVVVRYVPRDAPYTTLSGNCLANRTLPSLAFGGKGCSLKWKTAPQNQYRARQQICRDAWAAGLKCQVSIGYDCGKADSRRSEIVDDRRYRYRYWLREWGWDRERCKVEIESVGLPVPPKSACSFCPARKPHELTDLTLDHPELADGIILIEETARPTMRNQANGLWRSGCKGTRGSIRRTGRMTDWILDVRAGLIGRNPDGSHFDHRDGVPVTKSEAMTGLRLSAFGRFLSAEKSAPS